MSMYAMTAIAILLYWTVGLFALAIPMARRMYARQAQVGHYLKWWEWVNTFLILPLFWPAFAWDLWQAAKERRGR